MQSVINTVKGTALGFADKLTPILKESKFKETGVLTPEEFVLAGDHLVHHCPTWQWAGVAVLVCNGPVTPPPAALVPVPCYKRCKHMEYSMEHEKVLEEEGDEDGGWVDTHHYADAASSGLSEQVQEMTLGPSVSRSIVLKVLGSCCSLYSWGKDSQVAKLTSLLPKVQFLIVPTQATVLSKDEAAAAAAPSSAGDGDPSSLDGGIVSTRTYDLNITYDNYYRTPRLWLYGYDEKREPLSMEAMYEDISQDHAKKTVTMEAHPHLPGPPMASVHPCRHAEVMKKIIQTVTEGGRGVGRAHVPHRVPQVCPGRHSHHRVRLHPELCRYCAVHVAAFARELKFSPAVRRYFLNLKYGVRWRRPMHSWPGQLEKEAVSFSSSSSSDADSDTDVYLVSGSEDSDDCELSSSSGDNKDSGEANIATAREWILLYVDNPPVKAHRFPFLAIPGKTFILSSPGDIMEYIQQFLDDELI
ncbi:hypothetical protein HPB48_017085 [Haemaphysalis longicornis]|uniref:Ubiquitin-like-conjugating enzyme ATG3 n=1 Tax=Haemaphysalis longicornis TaxID=44386 RepID=A0A9J6FYH7_HAELO|nr:hypothetical protein HPB48_017085 [Haemaphysalis longicornis]